MKFFRMDSDLPDWPAWKTVRKLVGRRQYQNARLVYIDMYSYIAQQYSSEKHDDFEVVIDCLTDSTRLARQTVVDLLPKLGQAHAFRTTFVDHMGDACTPLDAHAVTISYPNFVKKQEKYKKKSERIIQDKDEEKEREKKGFNARARAYDPPRKINVEQDLVNECWDAYEAGFITRYERAPIRNEHQEKQIAKIIERVGPNNAVRTISMFIKLEKRYYRSRHYPLSLCLEDAETLAAGSSEPLEAVGGELENMFQ